MELLRQHSQESGHVFGCTTVHGFSDYQHGRRLVPHRRVGALPVGPSPRVRPARGVGEDHFARLRAFCFTGEVQVDLIAGCTLTSSSCEILERSNTAMGTAKASEIELHRSTSGCSCGKAPSFLKRRSKDSEAQRYWVGLSPILENAPRQAWISGSSPSPPAASLCWAMSAKVRAFVDWAAELFARHPHL